MATATQDVTIWDETHAGQAVHLDAASLPATRAVVLMGASDGSNIRAVKTDSSGNLVLASTSVVGANLRDGSGNLIDSRLYDDVNNAVFTPDFRSLDVIQRRMPLVACGANAVAGDAGWWAGDTTVATVSKTNLVSISLSNNQVFFCMGWSINRATQGSAIGAVKTLEVFKTTGSVTTVKAKCSTNAAAGTDLWEVWLSRAIQLNPKEADTYSIRLTVTDSAATSTIWSYRIIGVII